MAHLLDDLRFTLRSLTRQPTFVAGAVLSLAIGLAANATISSIAYRVLWRPLPLQEDHRLMMIWDERPENDWHQVPLSPANFLDLRDSAEVFSDIAAYVDSVRELTLLGDGPPRILRGNMVYGEFFSTLGVPIELGRDFVEDESWAGSEPVAILSHRLWRQLGADPGMVGERIRFLDFEPVVIGVLPREIDFPFSDLDVWLPIQWNPQHRSKSFFRQAHYLRPVARLAPDVTYEQAAAYLELAARRLAEQHPEANQGLTTGATPLREWVAGDHRTSLVFLLASATFLLTIAVANVTSLQLSRFLDRRQELAVRRALGGPRWRIAQQMVVEGALVTLGSVAVGLPLSVWLSRALTVLAASQVPRLEEDGAVWVTIGLLLSVAAVIGLLISWLPAIAFRSDSRAPRPGNARSATAGHGSNRTRRVLVVAEVAVATLLLIAAVVLARSFILLRRVDPGFDASSVLTARITLPYSHYREREQATDFFVRLLERLRPLPDAVAVSATGGLPLRGYGWTGDLVVRGRESDDARPLEFAHRTVDAHYFDALGVPVLAGRGFTARDDARGPGIVVVNEVLAARYFKGEDPVGRQISFLRQGRTESGWLTIVGVVGNESMEGLDVAPRPEVIEPFLQTPVWAMNLLIRTRVNPLELVDQSRGVLADLDPSLPLSEVATLGDIVSESIRRESLVLMLMLVFATVALVLSLLGIVAVTRHTVVRRSREIAIRSALGADRRKLLTWLMAGAVRLTAWGLMLGWIASLGFSQFLQKLLFRGAANDPAAALAAILTLFVTALGAGYLPARRALRTDPARILHQP